MLKTIYMTVADYWYQKEEEVIGQNTQTEECRKRMTRWVLPNIGTMRISEVDQTDLEYLFRKLSGMGKSVSDLQQIKALLRRLFHIAQQDRLIRENPVNGLDMIPTVYRELSGLSGELEVRLLRAFRKTAYPELYALIMITGTAFRELIGCRISDFSEEDKSLIIRRFVTVKGAVLERNPRKIRLSETAVKMVKRIADQQSAQKSGQDAYLFTGLKGKPLYIIPRQDLKVIREESGWSEFSLAKLRNAYGVRAVELGVNPRVLNRHMGFKTGFNLVRYAAARERMMKEDDGRQAALLQIANDKEGGMETWKALSW